MRPQKDKLKIFFYVQHLLGVGHVHRAVLIANKLQEAGFEVYFINGGRKVSTVDYTKFNFVQLPPIWSADVSFETLHTTGNIPINTEWRILRKNALLEHYHSIQPDIILIESYPFGRRFFRFELIPLLEAAFDEVKRPLILSSIRDILVRSKPQRVQESLDMIQSYFDGVLVHGDEDFFPFSMTYPEAEKIKEKTFYTGYVAPSPSSKNKKNNKKNQKDMMQDIIVSVGGGFVGLNLIKIAIKAKKLSKKASKMKWRILVGANIPEEDYLDLKAHKDKEIYIERARPDFAELLGQSKVSISQAGYNTVMDLMQSSCKSIVIPFVTETETEQEMRATLLAQKGYLKKLDEKNLTPQKLADAIDDIFDQNFKQKAEFKMDGVSQIPQIISKLYKYY